MTVTGDCSSIGIPFHNPRGVCLGGKFLILISSLNHKTIIQNLLIPTHGITNTSLHDGEGGVKEGAS
jgi:hypothetical protein